MSATATKPGLSSLYQLVASPLEDVKQSLREIVPPQSETLAGTVTQSLNSGGKYLRPVVTLLCGTTTGTLDHQLVEVAAVSEMIHIATLLHDDVIDQSELRRGKKTISAELGNKISVLSGDYLLAQASLKLSKLGNTRLVAIYAQVLADLCDGEVIQMNNSYALNQPMATLWEEYFRKTHCKTASLFAAGCEAAGVVNQLPEEDIQHLRSFGQHFGIVFQMVDDLLDYTSSADAMGKPVLDDLRNGIMNAPILLALESPQLDEAAQQYFRTQIQRIFETPDSPEAIATVQDYLQQTNAIEETRALTKQHVARATESLAFVPDSDEKQALTTLLEFIIDRKH